LQHDIRAPSNEVTKLLLNYTIGSNFSETKCLSINENKPHLLAVGCNDPFARVYDRRMIKLKSFSSRITSSDVSANESSK
jgi:WD and tetratricopeptide repeat-containing protein 1